MVYNGFVIDTNTLESVEMESINIWHPGVKYVNIKLANFSLCLPLNVQERHTRFVVVG